MDDDANLEQEDTSEWAVWEKELEPFDLLAVLKLSVQGQRIAGGDDRVRAEFHKRAWPAYPRDADWYEDEAQYETAVVAFRRICLAFTVLKDLERRRIYLAAGFDGLYRSEACQEESVFDADAVLIFEGFFEGTDEADREYLLLNGDDPPSEVEWEEDEDDSAAEVDEDADDDEPPEVLSSKLQPGQEQLKLLAAPPPRPPLSTSSALGVVPPSGADAPPASGVWASISSRVAAGEEESLKESKTLPGDGASRAEKPIQATVRGEAPLVVQRRAGAAFARRLLRRMARRMFHMGTSAAGTSLVRRSLLIRRLHRVEARVRK